MNVIELNNISVHYTVFTSRADTLKENMLNLFNGNSRKRQEVQALSGVSLSVREGETVGVVGHNGAGKSTLLKVISRMIKPTTGRVMVRKPLVPLLGLGAGFHPELTGYENVLLNGAILGFSPDEMKERMHQIVEFSELHNFMEAPLRTYSSGMRLRLGFGVVSTIDPEILLIDEVLAVGDEAFRNKCQNWLDDFQQRGHTLVIISHQLAQMRELCDRIMWLENGKVREIGDAQKIIHAYHLQVKNLPGPR